MFDVLLSQNLRENGRISDRCSHRAAVRRAEDSPPYLAVHGAPLSGIGTMNLPLTNPSQGGNRSDGDKRLLPSWEGRG